MVDPWFAQHPTVSVIDIDAILLQITGILDKVSLAVQAVFVFTLAAGIAVLFAAVQSTIDERRFESAMLRALGVRRRTVLSGVLTEFAALGFAAGFLASAGASILAARRDHSACSISTMRSIRCLWVGRSGGRHLAGMH